MASRAAATAPAPYADGDALLPVRFKGLLTLAIMMAMMMVILDTTIANVALPHMQTSLGATIDTIAWVLTAYIVATAVAIPITGWLSDRVGSRPLFLWSMVFFIVTSVMCGLATSLEQMVVFRILQGIAAAFIGPVSQTAMLDINPSHKHGSAMAIWSVGAILGPIMGPLIGGWITEYYSWRWVFFVNLPIGAVVLAMLYFLLPGRKTRRRSFDSFGFFMLALGIASLQLVLDRGQQLDWLDSAEIWIGLACIVIGFWVFIVHMATGRGERIITPSIFRDRNFVMSTLHMFIAGILVFATMVLIAPMLQVAMGYPVIDAGLLLAPRGIGVIFAMGLAARLMRKIDGRILLAIGWVISAWSCMMMTGWSLQMGWQPVVTVGIIQGAGIGFILVPINTMAFVTLPLSLRPEAAAMLNLMRNVGASVGISVTVTYAARLQQVSHADLAAHITPATLPSIDLTRFGVTPEAAMQILDNEINRQALMIAYIDDFWLIMWLCILAIPAVLLMKKVPKDATQEQVEPPAADPEQVE